ncbi:MAG: DUF2059 domain-containing protein [Paracoccaceae bacterium]
MTAYLATTIAGGFMRQVLISAVMWAFFLVPVQAQVPNNIRQLADALGLDAIIDVMQEEGISYGDEMALDMFPGQAGPRWHQMVEVIYDRQAMENIVLTALAEGLENTDTAPLTTFFSSDLGRRIVRLEIGARQALMDETIEEVAIENVEQMIDDDDPRLAMIEEFIDANDLLDANVVGALNANYAFYLGLVDGGGFPEPIGQDQILEDVWGQEQEIRDDTTEWLYSYLAMAYQPLSDDDLQTYTELSRREDGKKLNQILFEGFDEMFVGISRALGIAAGQMMTAQDI